MGRAGGGGSEGRVYCTCCDSGCLNRWAAMAEMDFTHLDVTNESVCDFGTERMCRKGFPLGLCGIIRRFFFIFLTYYEKER